MNILIIGSGFVGTHIGKELAHNHSVTLTTTTPEKLPELKAVTGSALLIDTQESLCDLDVYDVVILCVAPKNNASYASTYLKSGQMVVESLRKGVKHLIYTSSCGVYQEHGGGDVDESSPLHSGDSNPAILARTEELLRSCETPERNVTLFRLGEIYGKERSLKSKLLARKNMPMPIAPETFTNLTHIDDILAAIQFAIDQHLSGTYNLVDDEHTTRGELYDRVCKKHHLPPVHFDADRSSKRNKLVSNQKIKRAGYHLKQPTHEI